MLCTKLLFPKIWLAFLHQQPTRWMNPRISHESILWKLYRDDILYRRYHGIVNFNGLFIWLKTAAVSAWNFKFNIRFFLFFFSKTFKYYNTDSLSTLYEQVLLTKTTIYLYILVTSMLSVDNMIAYLTN